MGQNLSAFTDEEPSFFCKNALDDQAGGGAAS